jgi:hypothetical protein
MVERNIQNGCFGWYEKKAMEKIETLPFKRQASCKLIYIALCSLSAKNRDKKDIFCYKFDIARYASVSEKTVQRYLPELEKLNIVKVYPQDRKSNGKYEKVKIKLVVNNLPLDTSETDQRQIRDTESDILNKTKIKHKEKKKKKKKKFILPERYEKISDTWKNYLAMRKKKKKPATDHAKDLIIRKLNLYSLSDCKKALEASIVNAWTDVYLDKYKKRKNSSAEKRKEVEDWIPNN